MIEELFKLKVACLLHDPTIKPLLFREEESHEKIAKEITEKIKEIFKLDININKDVIRKADWIASSTDRFIISELYDRNKVKVIKEVYVVNILSMAAKRLDEVIFDKLTPDWISKFKDEFIKEILSEFNKIDELYKSNKLHIIYHIFWRFLIDATVDAFKFNIKEISLLPADTRVPYYTIYDHLYTTSAFITAAKEDGKIGMIHWEAVGTQSFILESRAFRDLWASSFLISLLNTIVIIKLAKEYGFDSILIPNMLYNPLVDLYLYTHTRDRRLNIKYEDLRILTTPDKGFAILPYDKVNQHVNDIVDWFNEEWKRIAIIIKSKIEGKIKAAINKNVDLYHYSLRKYLNLSDDNLITEYIEPLLTWDGFWNEFSDESPIKFVCVGESFELNEEKLYEKLNKLIVEYKIELDELYRESSEKILEEFKILRKIAKIRYNPDFQFFEFPLIIEILKKKRKLVSELTRMNVPRWIMKSHIDVKDKRLICSICYKRPAIIFYCDEFKEIIALREGERLCPVCLIKRSLATADIFNEVLASLLNFADDSLNQEKYNDVLKDIEETYKNRERLPRSSLSIPSLDTFATLTFRSSLIRYGNHYIKMLYDTILELLDDKDRDILVRNMPDIRWFDRIKDRVPSDAYNMLLIGGEFFLVEELRKEYRNKIDKIKELERKFSETARNITSNLKDRIGNDVGIVATTPGKYVALIRADGDDMGKLFTLSSKYMRRIRDVLPKELSKYLYNNDDIIVKDGEREIKMKNIAELVYIAGPSFYAYISRTLSTIARNVVNLSTRYATWVVYAGGDDILALSPVELSLFFCLRARELFSKEWLEPSDKVVITGLGRNSTQSFAIRYFHIFEPLSKELQDSYIDLDNIAKNLDGKNGLVITYKARNGNIKRGILRWEEGIVERIYNLASLTLRYKRIWRLGSSNSNIEHGISGALSKKTFTNVLDIINDMKQVDEHVADTIISYEFKRHAHDDKIVKLGLENIKLHGKILKLNDGQKLLIVELLNGAYALLSALDSNPLVLGESL